MKVKAGDASFIAPAQFEAKNVAPGTSKILATYFAEKGKPLVTMVK